MLKTIIEGHLRHRHALFCRINAAERPVSMPEVQKSGQRSPQPVPFSDRSRPRTDTSRQTSRVRTCGAGPAGIRRNAKIPFRRGPQRPRRAPPHERDEGRHPEVPSFACVTCVAAARNRDAARRAAAAAAGRQSPNSLRMASTASSRSQPKNSTSRSTSLPCSRKVTVFV